MTSRPIGRWGYLTGCAVFVAVVLLVGKELAPPFGHPDQGGASGLVVDEHGDPVAGAGVSTAAGTMTTDAAGEFRVDKEAGAAQMVSVAAPGFLDRAVWFDPTRMNLISLTTQTQDSISLRFGGDVMMGRRYYSGRDSAEPLLVDGANAAQHAEILKNVAPLLEDADITAVNLETPLVTDPYFDPDDPRPTRFHPTKDLAFASAIETAEGLRQSGVDVVALGNNHVYDALGGGLDSTVAAADAAGLAHFGAGRTPDDAWKPAIVERPGGRVAYLGCTTVTGDEHGVAYIANGEQGGSAECNVDRLVHEVQSARREADVVVVMVHGGVEYQRTQSELVRKLSQAAKDAGASVVMNGHSHVVGGIEGGDEKVEVESTGNLAFDQEIWETYPGQIVRVDLHSDSVVNTTIDPILLDGYVPRPAASLLSDRISRIAAGTIAGGPSLTPGGVHGGRITAPPTTRAVDFGTPTVARIEPGWWLSEVPDGGVRAGTDLLNGTGYFGYSGVENAENAEGSGLWETKEHAKLTRASSCAPEEFDRGMEMARGPLSEDELVTSPRNRMRVRSGSALSLLIDVRFADAGATAALHWYRGQTGESMGVTSFAIPEMSSGESCRSIRFDVNVPAGVTSALPFVRLEPMSAGQSGQSGQRLAVDNVSLVEWAEAGAVGKTHDTLDIAGTSTVVMTSDVPVGKLSDRGPFWDERTPR